MEITSSILDDQLVSLKKIVSSSGVKASVSMSKGTAGDFSITSSGSSIAQKEGIAQLERIVRNAGHHVSTSQAGDVLYVKAIRPTPPPL